jgi:hypothetical protein
MKTISTRPDTVHVTVPATARGCLRAAGVLAMLGLLLLVAES